MKNYRSNPNQNQRDLQEDFPISKDELIQDFLAYSKKGSNKQVDNEIKEKQNYYGKIVNNNNNQYNNETKSKQIFLIVFKTLKYLL